MDFTVCGEKIEPETIGFDPYSGPYAFGGEPLFVGPEVAGTELQQLDLEDRIVITTSPVNYFSLMFHSPQLIVYVSNSDFTSLMGKACTSCDLTVKGIIETHASANVVAELAGQTRDGKEVLISAHWDSYRGSPGADDNGSGVGVLLELAHFFSTFEGDIGGTIKFVLFGCEELGVLGSRAYLNTHHKDLQGCILVFNMDQVGGPRGPAVEMSGGVRGIPDRKGATQFPARVRNRTFESLCGRWRIVAPDIIETFMVTNRPPWLVEAVETSVGQLGLKIKPTGNLGTDQQVFTQAGIVATGIGTCGNRYHGPADVAAQINKEKLEIVGKIVANVVLTSLRSGEKK